MLRHVFGAVFICVFAVSTARAKDIYVDNTVGADRADGLVAIPTNEQSGPVRSLRRAMQLVGPGDALHLANTGTPYFESLSIVGKRLSGTGETPLRIFGNGATLSGALPVPESAWQKVGDDLYRIVPWRKGHYRLILSGMPIEEVQPAVGEHLMSLPELTPHQWCSHRGAIYYREAEREEPMARPFWFASHECGITVYSAQNVVISDLTVQHFRVDGIGVPNLTRDIVLRNVKLTENGRAGLRVGGTGMITLRGCNIEKNGRHSLLIQGLGAANVVESDLDEPPTFE